MIWGYLIGCLIITFLAGALSAVDRVDLNDSGGFTDPFIVALFWPVFLVFAVVFGVFVLIIHAGRAVTEKAMGRRDD